MCDTQKAVTRVIETYQAAVLAKDVAAFMQLYDPKVLVFDTWGVWSYQGAPAWQLAVEGWFSGLGSERCAVDFDEVNIIEARDAAFVSAFVRYTALAPDGRELRSMQNRLSWALRTSGNVLRVVHEHTSAPVGFEDLKAILQRTPGA